MTVHDRPVCAIIARMIYASIFLIGLSLSMDAFAVAITIGICRAEIHFRHAAKVALFFGGFQALMPAIGYLAGRSVSGLIKPFDHWVAFVLLGLIGGKMLYEALREVPVDSEEDACPREDPVATRPLLILAVATSIDALAAGISLAIGDIPIVSSVISIGLITAILSGAGVLLGRRLGALFQKYATIVGGSVLVLIGVKILAEHLTVV